ncbi:reverse transcriptase [Plakobranchus ocellatus]|uniref:Reverse transcriptase n=1 Tax=Plakobranchus ocellatus TaxID=259542 RepID=A0AAV4AMD9_9GAST|nr:reverse transcriptase [Plakobranchus ocellatus]
MSGLDLYAEYLDLGVRLGRSGEYLSAWVEDKVRQDMERSDRQIERERKREEMGLQKQRGEMELQKHREEMEMQREEREMQKQKEEMELQKRREEIALQDRREERELKRLELEAETKKLEIGSKKLGQVILPKDLRYHHYMTHPSGGPRLSVKRVLLQRFGYDRNGFRSKFLSVKPQEAEDFGTFINRARRYFDRWVELSGVTTLEGLSYLVCSEIALQACNEDFVAYVKDRSPSDIVSLKTVASAYMDARPNKSFRRK